MFDKLKDLGGLMQQAQAMQQKVQELQAELERMEIVGSSGACRDWDRARRGARRCIF